MKKFTLLTTTILTLGILSCNQTSTDETKTTKEEDQRLKVIVNLSTTTGVDDKQVTKDSIYEVETDYFEIGLYSVGHGTNYIAEKEFEEAKSIENFKSVTMYLIDSAKKTISFNSSTEFLNYMSERGYKMRDQQKLKFHTDYTFKRK